MGNRGIVQHQRKSIVLSNGRVFPPVDRRIPSPGNGDRCKPENVIAFFSTSQQCAWRIFCHGGFWTTNFRFRDRTRTKVGFPLPGRAGGIVQRRFKQNERSRVIVSIRF